MAEIRTDRMYSNVSVSRSSPARRPMVIQQVPKFVQNSELSILPQISTVSLAFPPSMPGSEVINVMPCLTPENQANAVQVEEEKPKELITMPNPFHMRPSNLSNFPPSQTSYRTTYRSQAVVLHRVRAGCITSAAKSLDLLRQNIQKSINKELDEIIQRYLEKFVKPGIENIKMNNGDNAVSEEHVHTVCRQILEEAKKMYSSSHTRGSTPLGDASDTDTGSQAENRSGRIFNKIIPSHLRKRKESDTDSEASQIVVKPKKKKGRPPLHAQGGLSGRSTPSKQGKFHEPTKREGPKWDPVRLTKDTLFVMGAKANKALGLGATRGRLYIKHPELFKYSGDQDDKQWLYENNLMPATGGKAYMLVVDDIKDLAETDEYKNNPGLMLTEVVGFKVPEHIVEKMKVYMQSMRTDIPGKKHYRSRSVTPSEKNNMEEDIKIKIENETLPFSAPSNESETPAKDKTDSQSSTSTSPAEDLDLLSTENPSCQPLPFNMSAEFDEIGSTTNISPSPSDIDTPITDEEPPLSAPFDVN